MTRTDLVVVIHAASTWFLAGLIWMVQRVHYPLFARVGRDGFTTYQAEHSRRITSVLLLPWGVQGVTTAWLLIAPPPSVPRWLTVVVAILAAVPVVVTVIFSVPAHNGLENGFDTTMHRRLTTTNWLRTAAWSLHGALCLPLLVLALGDA